MTSWFELIPKFNASKAKIKPGEEFISAEGVINVEKRIDKSETDLITVETICGSFNRPDGLARHHPDYSKPTVVLSLCKSCHKVADKIRRLTSTQTSISMDRHCFNCAKTYPICGKHHPSYRGRACSIWLEKIVTQPTNQIEVHG